MSLRRLDQVGELWANLACVVDRLNLVRDMWVLEMVEERVDGPRS